VEGGSGLPYHTILAEEHLLFDRAGRDLPVLSSNSPVSLATLQSFHGVNRKLGPRRKPGELCKRDVAISGCKAVIVTVKSGAGEIVFLSALQLHYLLIGGGFAFSLSCVSNA